MGTPTSARKAMPRLLPMAALFAASFVVTLALHRSPVTSMASAPVKLPTPEMTLSPEPATARWPAGVEATPPAEPDATVPEHSPSLHELAADDDPATRAEARALLALLDEERNP